MEDIFNAEKYCIGAALHHSKDAETLVTLLRPDDYASPMAQICHRTIEQMVSQGKVATRKIVLLELNKHYPEQMLEVYHWIDTAALISHGVDIDYYAGVVLDASIRRKSIDTIRTAVAKLQEPSYNAQEILNKTIAELTHLSLPKNLDYHSVIQLLDRFDGHNSYYEHLLENQQKRLDGTDIFPGFRTGYKNLDSFIGGFKNGSFNIIGARSTSGKTTLMMNFMLNLHRQYPGIRQLFLTLEMPPYQIMHKLVGALASINPRDLEQGNVSTEEIERVKIASEQISNMDLILDGSLPATTNRLHALTRRLAFDKKPDIIFIDYLTRMKPSIKQQNKHLEIDDISKSLQDLALTQNIPVVCLCQLNRQVMSRQNKQPFLSDIRESGSIEEDADVVMLIHRPKLYNDTLLNDYTEIYVAKHRQYGTLGKITFDFKEGVLTELPALEFINPSKIMCEQPVKYERIY